MNNSSVTATGYCSHGGNTHTCRHCKNEKRAPRKPVPAASAHTGRMQGFVHNTSLWARVSMTESYGETESRVLEVLATRPMTDAELHAAYLAAGYPRPTYQRISGARKKLTEAGEVRETGEYGLSETGRRAVQWEVTPMSEVYAGILPGLSGGE